MKTDMKTDVKNNTSLNSDNFKDKKKNYTFLWNFFLFLFSVSMLSILIPSVLTDSPKFKIFAQTNLASGDSVSLENASTLKNQKSAENNMVSKLNNELIIPEMIEKRSETDRIQVEQLFKQSIKKWKLENAGISFIDLSADHPALDWKGNTAFEAASIIKLPIMFSAYERIYEKKLDPKQMIQIAAQNVTDSAWFPKDNRKPLYAGEWVSLQELIQLMITRSDNTATNTLMDLLNRPDINQDLKHHGIAHTQVAYKLSGGRISIADWGAIAGINQTTPLDVLHLLKKIVNQEVLSPTLCTEILNVMEQQMDTTLLPQYMPPNMTVHHKTGVNSKGTHTANYFKDPSGGFILNLCAFRL